MDVNGIVNMERGNMRNSKHASDKEGLGSGVSANRVPGLNSGTCSAAGTLGSSGFGIH